MGGARYDEGVLVGCRWFDRRGQEPLVCRGHGRSYGEYEYGEARADLDEAQQPPRQLKGFAKVQCEVGARTPVGS